MAGMFLQRPEEPALEKAVRAGTPEQWNVKDTGSLLSALIVPLPGADQAIVHSVLLNFSPILINTKHESYAKDIGSDFTEMISTGFLNPIDGTHLAFLWLWMFERSVLELERDNGRVIGPATVDVEPWRLALAEGIDDTIKRRLMLTHKLPFLKRNLRYTEDTLRDDLAEFASIHGHQEKPHINALVQRVSDLKREIREVEAELAAGGKE